MPGGWRRASGRVAATLCTGFDGIMADDATGPPHDITRPAYSREELREISAEAAARFPRRSLSEHLVLMEVNPTRVHAYWAVDAGSLDVARVRAGVTGARTPMVLRAYALDDGGARRPRPAFDTEVQGLNSSAYIDVWGEARRYAAELGVRGDDGEFVGLIASEPVTLPPERPSAPPDASPVPPAEGLAGQAGPGPPADEDWVLTWFPYPNAEDVPDDAVTPPADDTAEGPAPAAPEAGPAESPEAAAERDPLSLENVLTLSSYALGQGEVELEVNAELRIYGRTRPGRDLHLFGQPVRLRPDGSFSVTRPLPNGALVISTLLSGGLVDEGEE